MCVCVCVCVCVCGLGADVLLLGAVIHPTGRHRGAAEHLVDDLVHEMHRVARQRVLGRQLLRNGRDLDEIPERNKNVIKLSRLTNNLIFLNLFLLLLFYCMMHFHIIIIIIYIIIIYIYIYIYIYYNNIHIHIYIFQE